MSDDVVTTVSYVSKYSGEYSAAYSDDCTYDEDIDTFSDACYDDADDSTGGRLNRPISTVRYVSCGI